jgi:ethanolamine ammonia-lyase large subunit
VYRLPTPAARAEAAQFSGNPAIRFEYTVLSNIYAGGIPPLEAGAILLDKICDILEQQAAGNRLTAKLEALAVG